MAENILVNEQAMFYHFFKVLNVFVFDFDWLAFWLEKKVIG